ncbi:MAG TPA: hypothetical protein VEU96_23615 [Bryobacteraceae bacterium]|nr:hypothetical protein [Bryobacteraceae bacterium]
MAKFLSEAETTATDAALNDAKNRWTCADPCKRHIALGDPKYAKTGVTPPVAPSLTYTVEVSLQVAVTVKCEKRKVASPTGTAKADNPVSHLTIATADRAIALGLLDAVGSNLSGIGLDVQVVQASSVDELSDILSEGRTDAVIVPDQAVARLSSLGLIRRLDDSMDTLGAAPIELQGHGDSVVGVSAAQLGSVVTIPGKVRELPPGLLELLIALSRFFGDGGDKIPKKAQPVNSFTWEIAGADSLSSATIGCTPQTFQVQYTAVNAKLVHIIWSKDPPPGTAAVPRSALDDKGDAPDGKVPSTASLDRGTWNVPLCSVGAYKMTVTVQWLCTLTNVIKTETKTKDITVTA